MLMIKTKVIQVECKRILTFHLLEIRSWIFTVKIKINFKKISFEKNIFLIFYIFLFVLKLI